MIKRACLNYPLTSLTESTNLHVSAIKHVTLCLWAFALLLVFAQRLTGLPHSRSNMQSRLTSQCRLEHLLAVTR